MFFNRAGLVAASTLRTFVRRHLKPLLLTIGIIAIVAMVAWGAKSRLTGVERLPFPHPQRAPIPTNIQVETFRFTFDGFEPREINRQPGPFVLGIDNYRSTNASFELVREDGNRVQEIQWPRGQNRYRKLLHLPPGNYLLKELNHPDWTARINIGK